MIIRFGKVTATVAAFVLLASVGFAQTSPAPGPTAPPTPLPIPKRGDDLVLNPTVDECQKGWHRGLKWTKEQFDKFCAQLKISK